HAPEDAPMRWKAAVAIVLSLLGPAPALAWGERGHEITNRLAAESLPQDAPEWLRSAAARIAYLGYEPDRRRVPALGFLEAAHAPDHYVDLELLGDLSELKEGRYAELRELERRGVDKHEWTGLALYRAAETAEMLEAQVAALDSTVAGSPENAAARDAAMT